MNVPVEIGIDSFAAAHDDTSRALSPVEPPCVQPD